MLLRVALVLTLILNTVPVTAAPKAPQRTAIVLCYHVVESPSDTKFSLRREAFIQQMQYLDAAGYNVISLADLNDYVAGRKKSIPENAVVITIDDGWKCTYTEIYPVMKQFDFPFTVFIYPKFIGQSAYALSWKQVREMSDDGVDIQSHTFSHAFLPRGKQRTGGQSYAEWLRHELETSQTEIEKRTGRDVRYLAYPYGAYDDTVARAAAESGYEAALTCDYGPVKKGSDHFRMKRVMVFANTSFEEFRRNLGVAPLAIAQQYPPPGKPLDPQRPVVSAKIPDFENLDPESIAMSVLSLGNTPVFFDPRAGTVSMTIRDTMRGSVQRAVVWARDKQGRRVEASWSFLVPGAASAPDLEATKATSATAERRAAERRTTAAGGMR